MFILVHSKPRATSSLLRNHWGISLSNQTYITYNTTKKVTLIPSRHTLLLANTPTLRMRWSWSPQEHTTLLSKHTEETCLTNTRITLVTKVNLKSIEAEILSHTLWSISTSKQSQLFENQNLVVLKRLLFLKSVLLNLFKDVCYQILTNLFFAFKDWSKH